VEIADAVAAIDEHGFVVLPALLSLDELVPARAALPAVYPMADEFRGGLASERAARLRSNQFAGIEELPAIGADIALLAVHPKVVAMRSGDMRTCWTDDTRAGVGQRYPRLDLTPWT
jgi:hypothetical protein